MFNKNSRYFGLETIVTEDRMGRSVSLAKLRRLPATQGTQFVISDGSKLDVMSERQYKSATRFWHIADANSELEANELVRVTGRKVNIPEN